jgi:hypothetical protein
MDGRAHIALLWSEVRDAGLFSVADAIVGALAGGADVVNLSWGTSCGWACRNFGSVSGWNALSNALRLAEDMSVSLVVAAGNGTHNRCSDDIQDLGDFYQIPCEMADGRPVCVGGVNRSGLNVCNYGDAVDVWGPGDDLWITPLPSSPTTHLSPAGTSLASPFVAGVVAMATSMAGRHLSSSEVRTALRQTAVSAGDGRAPRVLNAYGFLRRFATVLEDSDEPNDNAFYGETPPLPRNALRSVAKVLYDRPPAAEQDWYLLENVPACGTVEFDVAHLPDQTLGAVEASVAYTSWFVAGAATAPDVRHFAFPYVDTRYSYPPSSAVIGVNSTDRLTGGYSIEALRMTANAYSQGEGPNYPETCDGVDNDCDEQIDEGFPDLDRDGVADCMDLDDDDDCIADRADNCSQVANGSRYCPQATPGVRTCGRSCLATANFGSMTGFDKAFRECIQIGPIDPACFVDGCPDPGPFADSELNGIVASALRLRADLRLQRVPLSAAIQSEFRTLDALSPDALGGRIVVPRMMAAIASSPGPAPANGSSSAAGLYATRLGTVGDCRPLRAVGIQMGGKLIGMATDQCIQNLQALCQLDGDGDGVGDACDPTP